MLLQWAYFLALLASSAAVAALPLTVALRASSAPPFGMQLGVDRGPSCESGAVVTNQLHQLRATHIRTHDAGVLDWCVLFPDANADAEDPASYAWSAGDAYFSLITSSGFSPYLRLGTSWSIPSPACLYPEVGVFARVAVNTVRHYTEGWGGGFVYPAEQLYLEIWNEPDGPRFWNASAAAFYALFDATARALKAHNPALQVGGPGVASAARDPAFSFALLDFVAQQGTPLDFFSFHGYGTSAAHPSAVYGPQAASLRAYLDKLGLQRAALHVTEWAPAILANQTLLDSPAYAAYVATALTVQAQAGVAVSIYYPGCEGQGQGSWGLFQDAGGGGGASPWRWAGRAFQAVGATLRDTPLPLTAAVGGAAAGEASALAGRSPSGGAVSAVVSAVSGETSGVALSVAGLPVGASARYTAWCIGGSGGGAAADPFLPCAANASAGAVGGDGVLALPLLPLEVPGVLWVQVSVAA
jgi:hypothetical protein